MTGTDVDFDLVVQELNEMQTANERCCLREYGESC